MSPAGAAQWILFIPTVMCECAIVSSQDMQCQSCVLKAFCCHLSIWWKPKPFTLLLFLDYQQQESVQYHHQGPWCMQMCLAPVHKMQNILNKKPVVQKLKSEYVKKKKTIWLCLLSTSNQIVLCKSVFCLQKRTLRSHVLMSWVSIKQGSV